MKTQNNFCQQVDEEKKESNRVLLHFLKIMGEAIDAMILETPSMAGVKLIREGKMQEFVGDIIFFFRKHIRNIQKTREDSLRLGLTSEKTWPRPNKPSKVDHPIPKPNLD